jgi:hypothetical protein
MRNPIHLYWKEPAAVTRFKTGVSLHSHTNFSEESLDIVPRYTAKVPYLGSAVRAQTDRYERLHGKPLDFARAYWTPPLSPHQAHALEERQIAACGLKALVSLSDHDNIHAGFNLSVLKPSTPVSVEWTIPFGPTYFHLGVHNLARATAHGVMERLRAFTADPVGLGPLLATLNDQPDTLLVLNHPFWDEAGIGASEHAHTLGCLLERHGRMIHALELNGLRPWEENARVVWLGRRTGLPVISGGDRHGCEPNSNINLTNATTFSEFADEVRSGRESTVLFLPQHKEPMRYRILQTMWDVMREYPDHPAGMRQWSDRVFFRDEQGVAQPVRKFFQGDEPRIVKQFSSAIRLVGSRGVRTVLRQALFYGEEEATF